MLYRRFAILEFKGNIRASYFPSTVMVGENEGVLISNHLSDEEYTTIALYSDIEVILETNGISSKELVKQANTTLEKRIEKAAALIAIGLNSSRKLRSTLPTFALKPETPQDKEFIKDLDEKIIEFDFLDSLKIKSINFPINGQTQSLFNDRFDGVISLAESLSSNSTISKFKELIRFFEIAYGATFSTLQKKIYKTIEQSELSYTRLEIKKLV